MSRVDFIQKLRDNLTGLSEIEVNDIVYDYEEHFEIGLSEGKTEDEISNALGDPKLIAKQFRADFFIKKAEVNKSTKNLVSAVFASVGLGFLNLLLLPFFITAFAVILTLLISGAAVAFSLLVALFSILISVFAAGVGLGLGGVFEIILLIAAPLFPDYIYFGINSASVVLISIGCSCLGVLIFFGGIKFTKVVMKASKQLVNVSISITQKTLKAIYIWILNYLRVNVGMVTKKEEI